jgi:hypothetical protein
MPWQLLLQCPSTFIAMQTQKQQSDILERLYDEVLKNWLGTTNQKQQQPSQLTHKRRTLLQRYRQRQ